MAKKKTAQGLPNPPSHARVSYLYQAANYLFSQHGSLSSTQTVGTKSRDESKLPWQTLVEAEERKPKPAKAKEWPGVDSRDKERDPLGLSRHLVTHMRAITLKSHVRLSHEMKHSLCKRCDTLLVPGSTSQCSIENQSKGRKKPWADVYVTQCLKCGTRKRFPVGSKRQPKGRPKAKLHETPKADTLVPGAVHHSE